MANPNAAQDARRYAIDHFWRGVVDGDGHVKASNSEGNVILTLCGSEGLMQEFAGYCAGITPHKRSIYHYPHGAGNVHYFTLSANKAKAVLNRIYSKATLGLTRKMNEFSLVGGDAL